MRSIPLAVLLAAALVVAAAAARAEAAALPPSPGRAAVVLQQQVDQNDDTRVGVQLAVLGAAAFTVVAVGLAGYLLRRKLGLTAPPPKQDAGGHH